MKNSNFVWKHLIGPPIFQKIDDYNYEYEIHIFFDDGFERVKSEDGKEETVANGFVKQLVESMEKAALNVYKNYADNSWLNLLSKSSTPYGGCLKWTLPGKTRFVVHLKDKEKIRQGKRWSQVIVVISILWRNF